MGLKITRDNINNTLDCCFDVVALGGIGYMSGHVMNYIAKVAQPSLFPKKPFIDLKSSAQFCSTFILVDRVAHILMLKYIMKRKNADRMVFSAIRLSLSFALSLTLLQTFPLSETTPLETKVAAIALSTALFVYTWITSSVTALNWRYNPNPNKNSWEF
ncbi:MAG: hypothetical protein H0W88_11700 [Parachlamydiaceae bacterium]|nr:hypothetical protein [Parachlamydiaceae bacterium]